MGIVQRKKRLWDAYRFPGFRPEATVVGVFGDPKARVIPLRRGSKKGRAAVAVLSSRVGMTGSGVGCETSPAVIRASTWRSRSGEFNVGGGERSSKSAFDFLADNPFYTKRFVYHIGHRSRAASITDVAREHHLDWQTVKALEKQYMEEQLRRAGAAKPQVMGSDEISIRKGHNYRIIVSDLASRRVIRFGGEDRSEARMDGFYEELGERKSRRIRLAVMDMWKPFRNSTKRHAPHAAVLFDRVPRVASLGRGTR